MSKKQTPEEADEQELREVEARLSEVLELMTARKARPEVDDALELARLSRDQHAGDTRPVFHVTKQHHAPTTMHTKTNLDLAEQLKTRIKLGRYALELEDALSRLSERYVAVLERMLARSRY